ncbi:hypothetical protein I4U23_007264 [Adineta vaga]|nr:hypothetical protein I4U23_007264 [Adineta vaga]
MSYLFISISNEKPQNRKESNENLSRIEYSSLHEIYIDKVHDNYIEEFLFDTKTYLSNNIELFATYESLERVTNNFTRESIRINCAKIDKLYFVDESKHLNSLKEYFPNVKIFSK